MRIRGHHSTDILNALASVGLKLVPDRNGVSSHEYMGAQQKRDPVNKSRFELKQSPSSRLSIATSIVAMLCILKV